jgi:hypothetical protein
MRSRQDHASRTAGAVRTDAGLTVIEIIIAVALSALLLTVVYYTYFSINRSIEAATEDQEALETGRILSELIKKDIRGISPSRSVLVGKNEVVDGHPMGNIEFVTSAGPPSDPHRLRRIGYALISDEEGAKILVKKESTDLNDPLDSSVSAPRVFEVSRIVKGFQIQFFDGKDWADGWDAAAAGALPAQIRVTIDVVNTKGYEKKFVVEETIRSTL